MTPHALEQLISHSRGQAAEIIEEVVAFHCLVDAEGRPQMVGRYKLVYVPHGSTGIHTLEYHLDEVDIDGRVVGGNGEPMGQCCGCQRLANLSLLVRCTKCGHLFHQECGNTIKDQFYCPAHTPCLPVRASKAMIRWILSPFIKFEE